MRTMLRNLGMNHSHGNECRRSGAEGRRVGGVVLYSICAAEPTKNTRRIKVVASQFTL